MVTSVREPTVLTTASKVDFAALLRKKASEDDAEGNQDNDSGDQAAKKPSDAPTSAVPAEGAPQGNATGNQSGTAEQNGNKSRDLGKEKPVEKSQDVSAENLRHSAEQVVRNIVNKLGLSEEVAAHAMNAAGNIATALGSIVNIEAIALNETAKVAGVTTPGLTQAYQGDLGNFASPATNLAVRQAQTTFRTT